jgi:hypothetical protein
MTVSMLRSRRSATSTAELKRSDQFSASFRLAMVTEA